MANALDTMAAVIDLLEYGLKNDKEVHLIQLDAYNGVKLGGRCAVVLEEGGDYFVAPTFPDAVKKAFDSLAQDGIHGSAGNFRKGGEES